MSKSLSIHCVKKTYLRRNTYASAGEGGVASKCHFVLALLFVYEVDVVKSEQQ